MSEIVQQEPTIIPEEVQERTYTRAELDAIIGDRLNLELAKYADYEDIKAKAAKFDELENASKTELQKATEEVTALKQELNALKTQQKVAAIRAKVAQEMGVPADLLFGEEEEDCKKQAEAILKFAQPNTYPGIRKSRPKRSAVPEGSDSMRELAHQMFGAK